MGGGGITNLDLTSPLSCCGAAAPRPLRSRDRQSTSSSSSPGKRASLRPLKNLDFCTANSPSPSCYLGTATSQNSQSQDHGGAGAPSLGGGAAFCPSSSTRRDDVVDFTKSYDVLDQAAAANPLTTSGDHLLRRTLRNKQDKNLIVLHGWGLRPERALRHRVFVKLFQKAAGSFPQDENATDEDRELSLRLSPVWLKVFSGLCTQLLDAGGLRLVLDYATKVGYERALMAVTVIIIEMVYTEFIGRNRKEERTKSSSTRSRETRRGAAWKDAHTTPGSGAGSYEDNYESESQPLFGQFHETQPTSTSEMLMTPNQHQQNTPSSSSTDHFFDASPDQQQRRRRHEDQLFHSPMASGLDRMALLAYDPQDAERLWRLHIEKEKQEKLAARLAEVEAQVTGGKRRREQELYRVESGEEQVEAVDVDPHSMDNILPDAEGIFRSTFFNNEEDQGIVNETSAGQEAVAGAQNQFAAHPAAHNLIPVNSSVSLPPAGRNSLPQQEPQHGGPHQGTSTPRHFENMDQDAAAPDPPSTPRRNVSINNPPDDDPMQVEELTEELLQIFSSSSLQPFLKKQTKHWHSKDWVQNLERAGTWLGADLAVYRQPPLRFDESGKVVGIEVQQFKQELEYHRVRAAYGLDPTRLLRL